MRDAKLDAMNNVQLLVPDLFPPPETLAARAGPELPALEKWLARAHAEPLAESTQEAWLCNAFGAGGQAVAAVTLQADGIAPGASHWMRADPVHLHIMQDRLILESVPLGADEAQQFCAALNEHFAADGLHFVAPHPQRWYLETESAPRIATHWLSLVEGGDVRDHLPCGAEAVQWHRVLNEAQMLLYAHPANAAREARGEWPVNSVWLWGGGVSGGELKRPYAGVCGDSESARAFAQVAGVPWLTPNEALARCAETPDGDMLFVWEGPHRAARRGNLDAWRASVQALEHECVAPLLALLRAGQVRQLVLDVPQPDASRRFALTRNDLWKFWRGRKRLWTYAGL